MRGVLEAFHYDGELFDVHFDEKDNIEKILMFVHGGFAIDMLDVTNCMTDWFKERAKEQWLVQTINAREQIQADRFNDDPDNFPKGAA